MPVAGMAYLDRPSPAGYFIFPDLSVRHEGKYRLSFNLFEELKESKDSDADPVTASPDNAANKVLRSNPMAPQAHVHFRLEVKSEPFMVFSAKKFPGLAESTALSRVVAEQGCRVRIRRDVRMRRRDTKSTKGFDDEYEENGYPRPDRFATPEMFTQTQSQRQRSVSNGSIDMPPSYGAEQRRPSMQDMSYHNQPNYHQGVPPTPVSQATNNGFTSHLSFGGLSNSHYQVPAYPPPNGAAAQVQFPYGQNGASYQYPQTTHVRQMSNPQSYGYDPRQTPQHPPYPSSQVYNDNNDYRPISDYRRDSSQSHQSYQGQVVNPYIQVDNRHTSMQQTYYPQSVQAPPPRSGTTNSHALPPLTTIQPVLEKKYEQPTPISAISAGGNYDSAQTKYAPPLVTTPQSATASSARNPKRSFSAVFDSVHLEQPMHSGMRPSIANQGQDVPQVEAEDGSLEDEYELPNLKMLSYRRADGTRTLKKCPSPISE